MDVGLLIIRVIVGVLFIGHGTQKLFGWFDGPGFRGATGMTRSLRYPMPRAMAMLLACSETLGGLMLATGFATVLAAAMLIGVMLNAIVAVHAPNGMWNQKGGMEFPIVMAAAALVTA